jgi:ribosomal-protein-alanine N-acetyltransferase
MGAANTKTKAIPVHIRWKIRRDLPEVLDIEHASFPQPWGEEDFIRCLRNRNCIGMVAEYSEKVVGFMVYELLKGQLRIMNFAVHPAYRRRGIGRAMIEKLKSKLSPNTGRRKRISLEIRDDNLPAMLFFRAMKFRGLSVLRDFYEESDQDAISFMYRLPARECSNVEV